MDNNKMLHETVVKDIIDVIDDIKNADKLHWFDKSKPNSGSIAKQASNLVLVFPVIISTSLNIETAMLISKAIERKCVSLLQILFSSISMTNIDNLQDYVNQFHKNIDTKMVSFDDFMNVMSKLDESNIEIIDKDAYDMVMEDMRNINYHLENNFNETAINDFKIVNHYDESMVMLEAIRDHDRKPKLNIHQAPSPKDQSDIISKQILPLEIKKANELMPTLMYVNFNSTNSQGAVANYTGVVGVKAKMYPVDSNDIINRITSKIKDRNGLFGLVRASTREISFFKDLAFAIDKAKIDAQYVAKDSNNASMFKVLERRAAKNRFNTLLKRNDASPITSLVLSQSEVEYIKQFNVDMGKSHTARTILEAYNLMDIVIADESLEIANFLFDDGDGIYEALTFDALEKQAADNSYKKIVNLLSRVNR